MKKLLKTGVIILCVAVLLTMFAGCGQSSVNNGAASATPTPTAAANGTASASEEPQAKTFEKKLELTIAYWDGDPAFIEANDPVYQLLKEKFNITINPMPITYDDYVDKTTMWIAAGQMPDILQTADNIGSQAFINWAKNGSLKAIPDDLENSYPNLAKLFDSPTKKATTIDGKYYFLPMANEKDYAARTLIVRKDWMNSLGLKKPETFDEFVEFLKAFKDADPDNNGKRDTIPLVVAPGQYDILDTCFAKGYRDNWIEENGVYKPIYYTEDYKIALKNLRALYTEGLLDRDFSINKYDDAKNKFIAGKAAVFLHQIRPDIKGSANNVIAAFREANPDKNIEDCIDIILPMKNTDGNIYRFSFTTDWWGEILISGAVDDEKYERILAFLDYLNSDEWGMICKYGFEGVDYIKNGDTIEVIREKDADGNPVAITDKYITLRGLSYLVNWDVSKIPYTDATVYDQYVVGLYNQLKDHNLNVEIDDRANYMINFLPSPKRMGLKIKTQDEIAKYILEKGTDEEIYNQMVERWKKLGIEEAIQEVNEMLKQ